MNPCSAIHPKWCCQWLPNLDSDLQSLEPGKNLENLVSSADGNYALTYNDSGIYATVGASFQTPRRPDHPATRRPIQTVCGHQ